LVVALSVQVLSPRLAFLFSKYCLLSPDPFKPRDRKQTNRVDAHPCRSRNADAPRWRVNTEVDILDVLKLHIDHDVTNVQLGAHQYSLCALIIRKIRSTSPASCSTPKRPALMTCSLARTPRHASGRTLFTVSSIFSARSST